MSNEPVVWTDRSPVRSRTSREIARLSEQTSVAMARIEARAELQTAKLDAIARVGERAMMHIAMLTQLEQQLAQLVPLAASRLEATGSAVALAMVEVVSETARRIDRC